MKSLSGILLLKFAFAIHTGLGILPPSDFRHVSRAELHQLHGVSEFTHPDIRHFTRLLLDRPRQQLIIGARNHLVRLNLRDLRAHEVVLWQPDQATVDVCLAKGRLQAECHNFIRVLLVKENNVFACGTNAFAPVCTWRPAKRLYKIRDTTTGVGTCPYDPSHNNTALLTINGDIYSGTVTDFLAKDPAIYRIRSNSLPNLRTMRGNSMWLNEPNFVSSYEIGDYVYIFFRETAVEYINCGKVVYSRVARICKKDRGGNFLLRDNWTTFLKARLNCSLPGEFPFYFNELKSTTYLPQQQLIYGLFGTPDTGMHGSALCVFNITAIQRSFEGSFKYQDNIKAAWAAVRNRHPKQKCSSSLNSEDKRSGATWFSSAQRFQLMDEAVSSNSLHPTIVAQAERWTHLAVDQVHVGEVTYHIVFVATVQGILKKLVLLPNKTSSCLLEEIHIFDDNKTARINTMKLIKDAVFMATDSGVLRVETKRCHRYRTKSDCIGARDPYCGWDGDSKNCTANKALPQDIGVCPDMKRAVNGKFGSFSKWTRCSQSHSTSKCYCRQRFCDSPHPQYGGSQCVGERMQVANCTVDGGWTAWSNWSSCSTTCGVGFISRFRSCQNPTPAFGGRICVGSNSQELPCRFNFNCLPPTPAPLHGFWSQWSEWTACTTPCGGGHQKRRRLCNSPTPQNGGRVCTGNDVEWQACNNHVCPEVRKSSSWTAWARTNVSKQGFTEERFRLVCKAHVSNARLLRISPLKRDVRFCSRDSNSCRNTVFTATTDVDGKWTSWTPWSICNRMCGGGVQWRDRQCADPAARSSGRVCSGRGLERRECNKHGCIGMWSCWSEFSACSSSCGPGVRSRSRTCTAENVQKRNNNNCHGKSRDDEPCNMQPCRPERDGWSEWTLWSLCSADNQQQRQRVCSRSFLHSDCPGAKKEERICFSTEVATVSAVCAAQQSSSCISGYHLAVVGVVCFLLGGAVFLGLYLHCKRRGDTGHYQHRGESVAKETYKFMSLPHPTEVKQNIYIAPSDSSVRHFAANTLPLNNRYYSTNSIQRNNKDYTKMTVREATLKRNSLLRTNLSLNDI